jgi:hypothetical protein
MKGLGGRGQGKPGRGTGKGKGKGKDSGAGVGSTYANPGRPKSFQPTQQDRQRTGNIAEYFRRAETTPQPVARVFASAQMRGGLEASRPRASAPKYIFEPHGTRSGGTSCIRLAGNSSGPVHDVCFFCHHGANTV